MALFRDNNNVYGKLKSKTANLVSKFKSKQKNNDNNSPAQDNFEQKNENTNASARTNEERTTRAVINHNVLNEQKLVAATNYFAELDNEYQLLQEYGAFRKYELDNVVFEPVSADTVSAMNGRKQVEIKCKTIDDKTKLHEINFADGSQLCYVSFLKGGKMEINGEEYDMPEGTIIEKKSVNGKVISELIQTPELQRTFIKHPGVFDKVEQVLASYETKSLQTTVLPTPEYIQNLLGSVNGGYKPLSYLSAQTLSNQNRTPENDIVYLEKSIEEGKLPKGTVISGIKDDGGRILTIQGENCTYEVCDSEMKVTDLEGKIRMIARYEFSRTLLGLWIVLYNNEVPVKASHYTPGNLNEPILSVTYNYNHDNTVTSVINSSGKIEKITQQIPDKSLCIEIDDGFKFVPKNQPHLGLRFEKQKPFNRA